MTACKWKSSTASNARATKHGRCAGASSSPSRLRICNVACLSITYEVGVASDYQLAFAVHGSITLRVRSSRLNLQGHTGCQSADWRVRSHQAMHVQPIGEESEQRRQILSSTCHICGRRAGRHRTRFVPPCCEVIDNRLRLVLGIPGHSCQGNRRYPSLAQQGHEQCVPAKKKKSQSNEGIGSALRVLAAEDELPTIEHDLNIHVAK